MLPGPEGWVQGLGGWNDNDLDTQSRRARCVRKKSIPRIIDSIKPRMTKNDCVKRRFCIKNVITLVPITERFVLLALARATYGHGEMREGRIKRESTHDTVAPVSTRAVTEWIAKVTCTLNEFRSILNTWPVATPARARFLTRCLCEVHNDF